VSLEFDSIAIVGAGAVGLYYGGRLAAAGNEVRFLVRSGLEALSRHGLQITSFHGDLDIPHPQVFDQAEAIGPVDLVIVAWKSTANDHLARILPPLLHAHTQVLTLQNGLGNCERIAQTVGPQRVLGGQCFVCINRMSPCRVDHSAGGLITIGEWRPDFSGRVQEIVRRFKAAQIPCKAVDNLEQAQWEKLVWNIPFNGLSVAEGGVTTDVLLASTDTENELRALMAEVVHTARALGHELSDEIIHFQIERTRPMGPYRTSSMIDYVEGREVEVDAIWREPLRRANAAGVATPHLARLLERIEKLTQRA
jgi:2-dehydropantoate 2-reductase